MTTRSPHQQKTTIILRVLHVAKHCPLPAKKTRRTQHCDLIFQHMFKGQVWTTEKFTHIYKSNGHNSARNNWNGTIFKPKL